METLVLFFDAFWKAYGEGFIMIVLSGVVIALFIELFVKKAFDSIEAKKSVKTWVCAGIAVVLSFVCALVVYKSSALPGGALYFPEWFFLVYLAQYLMSLYGIKRIKENWEKKGSKEKPAKVKKRTVSVDADTPVYTMDANGNVVEL